MVTGNLPFQVGDVEDTLDAVRTKEPRFPTHLSPQLTVSDAVFPFSNFPAA